MRRLTGARCGVNTALLAQLLDSVNHLAWMLSEDGTKRRNHPASVFEMVAGQKKPKETETYRSAADFDAAWKNLMGGDE